MRKRERLQIGERKYIYSELSDEALFLEAGILFGMAMQRAVERQLANSEERVTQMASRVHDAVEDLFAWHRDAQQSKSQPRELITTKELASRLGVSLSTVHRWRTGPEFPAPIRLGQSIRWRLQEVEEWLRRHQDRRGD
jgi:excisionase family DNA binding protein